MSVPKSIVWEHGDSVTGSCDGRVIKSFPRPPNIADWIDDMRQWPDVSYGNIFNYCVLSVGVSGEEMSNFKGFKATSASCIGLDIIMVCCEILSRLTKTCRSRSVCFDLCNKNLG